MDIDEWIVRSVLLLRADAGLRRRVLALLDQMAQEVRRILGDAEELTTFRRQRLEELLGKVESIIERAYRRISVEVERELLGLAAAEAEWAVRASLGGGDLPTEPVLRRLVEYGPIRGAPSEDWWERQSEDARFKFTAAIRQGVVEGKTNAEIARDLRAAESPVFAVRRNAEALVRTSVQTVANNARLEAFRTNSDAIIGVRQISTLDARTTDICIAYDMQAWNLDGEPILGTKLPFNGGPPRHWNCRSTLVPIVKGIEEPTGERASAFGPVPASVNFGEWLASMPDDFANDLLGKGRAKLWRSGKISLQQLLDQSGRPLTMEQLRRRAG